jgi:hypothetical protein
MFRFTIRDVLWLTVVVAMGVGWWIDHRNSSKEIVRLDGIIQFQTDGLSGHFAAP